MSESKGPKKPTVKLFVGNLTEPCTDDVRFRNYSLVFNSLFLGLLNPEPSINKQKNEEKTWFLLFWDFFMTFIFGVLMVNDEKSRVRIR